MCASPAVTAQQNSPLPAIEQFHLKVRVPAIFQMRKEGFVVCCLVLECSQVGGNTVEVVPET